MMMVVAVMVMMVGDHQYCHMTLSVRGTVTVIMMVGCVGSPRGCCSVLSRHRGIIFLPNAPVTTQTLGQQDFKN